MRRGNIIRNHMKFIDKIKGLLKKEEQSKEATLSLKNWYSERYEKMLIQRNLLFLVCVISLITIALSVLAIRYIKSTRSIEPFVIEIERKTGVPTVVEPVSVKAYSADDAVKRYFVMKYIRAREEFIFNSYDYNYNTVVRVLSSEDVYYSDYRPKFSIKNPNSPYNLYGNNNYRTVSLKSIIFQSPTSAQVRIRMEVKGIMNQVMDKICFVEFKFANLQMNDDERLINPLGFKVTLYRIEDEQQRGA
ncbi:Type IV secretion system protein VirB8 [Candidatus Jidaibacter acanthamoeba]|uniref:Type IV secretion system protein VirB8 n=2 Tax=Candidatus Jidaibacter acanthamoebae TaxID=86105 RepID=A0A0C1QFF4_9RICK|nr:Type IV secretion system protein VirB8 [Candidatus Jidaibacter acanthamoeba]